MLLLHSDHENSLHIGGELGLPHLLFDLTSVMADKLNVIKVNMLNVTHSHRRVSPQWNIDGGSYHHVGKGFSASCLCSGTLDQQCPQSGPCSPCSVLGQAF